MAAAPATLNYVSGVKAAEVPRRHRARSRCREDLLGERQRRRFTDLRRQSRWQRRRACSATRGRFRSTGRAEAATSRSARRHQRDRGRALDPNTGRVFWALPRRHDRNLGARRQRRHETQTSSGATAPESCGRSRSIPHEPVLLGQRTGQTAISFANLSGGGGDMPTPGANPNSPTASRSCAGPAGNAPPSISEPAHDGASTLELLARAAGPGDAPASLFYRAPQTFAYQWVKGRPPDPGGANRSTSSAEGTSGAYACQVTATNFAGSATQTSAAVRVGPRTPSRGGWPSSGAAGRC